AWPRCSRRRQSWTGHPQQARSPEDAGAVAVMALERCPPDIPRPGRRLAHVGSVHDRGIIEAVSIPVMARPASATSSRPRSCSPSVSTHIDESESSPPPLRQPHRQVRLHRPVRVWRHQPSAKPCAASTRARR
ncbi:hypothetical protein GS934_17535, partial [Rhodococcus hoagii]|nr:hypothetical protein [Prescottella equi]NKZ88221.1 hypothetical protein [Prescottella equi]